ncbi:MAG: uroporphyrinogen decarboxylase [Flavobacteriales bacterium]
MSFQNDLILRAALGKPVERTPVWVMRQAGRVLPEYRATRARAGSFLSLLKNPELAAEVTIQPVDILDVDAAILFSDILVIPEAMGLPYTMDEGKGPHFPKTITDENDVNRLNTDGIEEKLEYVFATIRNIKGELGNRVPLIGFAGAPWTIFCYMTEGQGSKTFAKPRAILVRNPQLAHRLLTAIARATIVYLKKQIQEGCDMIQLFDSWAGILNKSTYNTFALPYIQMICDSITEVPVTVFAKGAGHSLPEIAALNCATIGLDWHTDAASSRAQASNKTLQGNLDPAALYGDFTFIKKATTEMLDAFGPQRYIANLGHGVYPDTEKEKLQCFIQTIKEHKYQQQ